MDHIISLRGQILANIISLTPSLSLVASVPRQESKRPCISALGVSVLSFLHQVLLWIKKLFCFVFIPLFYFTTDADIILACVIVQYRLSKLKYTMLTFLYMNDTVDLSDHFVLAMTQLQICPLGAKTIIYIFVVKQKYLQRYGSALYVQMYMYSTRDSIATYFL